MSSTMHLPGAAGSPLTLNRYYMELHNLGQRGHIEYRSIFSRYGAASAPTWMCHITIISVRPPYIRVPIGQTFSHAADRKRVARDGAAREALLGIGFNGVVN